MGNVDYYYSVQYFIDYFKSGEHLIIIVCGVCNQDDIVVYLVIDHGA